MSNLGLLKRSVCSAVHTDGWSGWPRSTPKLSGYEAPVCEISWAFSKYLYCEHTYSFSTLRIRHWICFSYSNVWLKLTHGFDPTLESLTEYASCKSKDRCHGQRGHEETTPMQIHATSVPMISDYPSFSQTSANDIIILISTTCTYSIDYISM